MIKTDFKCTSMSFFIPRKLEVINLDDVIECLKVQQIQENFYFQVKIRYRIILLQKVHYFLI
jgi:hypothetical protein